MFSETARLLSRVGAPFYVPTSNVCGIQFLHVLANTNVYCCVCVVVTYCGFDLHFHVEHLSMCLLAIHLSSLEK